MSFVKSPSKSSERFTSVPRVQPHRQWDSNQQTIEFYSGLFAPLPVGAGEGCYVHEKVILTVKAQHDKKLNPGSFDLEPSPLAIVIPLSLINPTHPITVSNRVTLSPSSESSRPEHFDFLSDSELPGNPDLPMCSDTQVPRNCGVVIIADWRAVSPPSFLPATIIWNPYSKWTQVTTLSFVSHIKDEIILIALNSSQTQFKLKYIITCREPPSLFNRPEHVDSYKSISALKYKVETHKLNSYLTEFESKANDDVLMISNISLGDIQVRGSGTQPPYMTAFEFKVYRDARSLHVMMCSIQAGLCSKPGWQQQWIS